MDKRTKIVATIGPATESTEQIQNLIENGVNLFRFNTKHNIETWHEEKINLVRQVAKKLKRNIGIVIDLQGPDVRTGILSKTELELNVNDTIYIEPIITKQKSIQLSEKYINHLHKGQEIMIDDGKVILQVIRKSGTLVTAKVIQGDTITEKKGIFFPNLKIPAPSLTKKDRQFIKLASKLDCEYVAISFVRDAHDLKLLKREILKNNREQLIISKIETAKSIQNIDELIGLSDAVMVARGDLGVEMRFEAVPSIQKKLINKCIKAKKPVIVATQMLKSMITNPHPSRAEISDVANAAYDSADAVMLSEETAIGEYSQEAVKYMAKTLKYNELQTTANTENNIEIDNTVAAIVASADSLEINLSKAGYPPKYFIVLTESGSTAAMLSATRPSLPILAFTQKQLTARKLSLNWGVQSFIVNFDESITKTVKKLSTSLLRKGLIKKGDTALVISGQNVGVKGQTDSIRIVTF